MEIIKNIIAKLLLVKRFFDDYFFLYLDKLFNISKIKKLKKRYFKYICIKYRNGNIKYKILFCGIRIKHNKRRKELKWDFGKKKIKINKEAKQYKLNKKLAIFIVTANHPKEIDRYLYAMGEAFYDLQIDCYVLDSSDDDSTKEVVEKWIKTFSKKNKEQYLFYDRYDEEPVGDSLDKKVLYAFRKYCDKYEYLWPIRDRSGIVFNNCIKEIYDQINNKKPDMLIIYETEREMRDNDDEVYTDNAKLFKDHYNLLTALQHWILKSSFTKQIMNEIPLNETNYSLYFPTATFHYIDKHPFVANVLVKEYMFKYAPSVVRSSHWQQYFFKQWFGYFYNCLVNLPEVYRPYLPTVLKEFDKRYMLFSLYNIIRLYVEVGFNYSDIDEYKKGINLVSVIPLEMYYKIADEKVSKTLTKKKKIRSIYTKLNNDEKNEKMGLIEELQVTN